MSDTLSVIFFTYTGREGFYMHWTTAVDDPDKLYYTQNRKDSRFCVVKETDFKWVIENFIEHKYAFSTTNEATIAKFILRHQ